ncbi:MAG: DNA-binding domain-containing protein [Xenococcaceae cyanobacterium]
MESPHISIRIPPKLNEQLIDYVQQHGLSKTEVMVSALIQYLGCEIEISLTQPMADVERRLAKLEAMVNTN